MVFASLLVGEIENMNQVKSLAQAVLTAFLIVAFPIVVFTLFTSKSPVLLGIKSFVVLTGSMEPTVPTGSIIYSIKDAGLRVGDVIAFKSGEVIVTHRIVKVQDQAGQRVLGLVAPMSNQSDSSKVFYQTKGDANKVADSKLVESSQVVGKVLFLIPFVGRVVIFLKTPVGFVLLFVLPTLAYVFFELWNIKREIVKNTERKILERMKVV